MSRETEGFRNGSGALSGEVEQLAGVRLRCGRLLLAGQHARELVDASRLGDLGDRAARDGAVVVLGHHEVVVGLNELLGDRR